MKRYIIVLSSLFFPAVAFAHGAEGLAEENLGISHQIEELSPFTHFSEGHWFAGIILVLLWASLAYTIWVLINKINE